MAGKAGSRSRLLRTVLFTVEPTDTGTKVPWMTTDSLVFILSTYVVHSAITSCTVTSVSLATWKSFVLYGIVSYVLYGMGSTLLVSTGTDRIYNVPVPESNLP